MIADKNQLQLLISELDDVLRKANPRLPWLMSGGVMQQRQVLERVRGYLLTIQQEAAMRERLGQSGVHASLPYDIHPVGTGSVAPASMPGAMAPMMSGIGVDHLAAVNAQGVVSPDAAQQLLQVILREMTELRSGIMQPLQQDVMQLQRHRDELVSEIKQLEFQRQQYTIEQRQFGQQLVEELVQRFLVRLQDVMAQRFPNASTDFPAAPPAPLRADPSVAPAGGEIMMHPMQRLEQMQQLQLQADKLMMTLDSTLRLIFTNLQNDIQSYQDSLSQGLDKMHHLGQQGEVMLAGWLNLMAQRLSQDAANLSSYPQASQLEEAGSMPSLQGEYTPEVMANGSHLTETDQLTETLTTYLGLPAENQLPPFASPTSVAAPPSASDSTTIDMANLDLGELNLMDGFDAAVMGVEQLDNLLDLDDIDLEPLAGATPRAIANTTPTTRLPLAATTEPDSEPSLPLELDLELIDTDGTDELDLSFLDPDLELESASPLESQSVVAGPTLDPDVLANLEKQQEAADELYESLFGSASRDDLAEADGVESATGSDGTGSDGTVAAAIELPEANHPPATMAALAEIQQASEIAADLTEFSPLGELEQFESFDLFNPLVEPDHASDSRSDLPHLHLDADEADDSDEDLDVDAAFAGLAVEPAEGFDARCDDQAVAKNPNAELILTDLLTVNGVEGDDTAEALTENGDDLLVFNLNLGDDPASETPLVSGVVCDEPQPSQSLIGDQSINDLSLEQLPSPSSPLTNPVNPEIADLSVTEILTDLQTEMSGIDTLSSIELTNLNPFTLPDGVAASQSDAPVPDIGGLHQSSRKLPDAPVADFNLADFNALFADTPPAVPPSSAAAPPAIAPNPSQTDNLANSGFSVMESHPEIPPAAAVPTVTTVNLAESLCLDDLFHEPTETPAESTCQAGDTQSIQLSDAVEDTLFAGFAGFPDVAPAETENRESVISSEQTLEDFFFDEPPSTVVRASNDPTSPPVTPVPLGAIAPDFFTPSPIPEPVADVAPNVGTGVAEFAELFADLITDDSAGDSSISQVADPIAGDPALASFLTDSPLGEQAVSPITGTASSTTPTLIEGVFGSNAAATALSTTAESNLAEESYTPASLEEDLLVLEDTNPLRENDLDVDANTLQQLAEDLNRLEGLSTLEPLPLANSFTLTTAPADVRSPSTSASDSGYTLADWKQDFQPDSQPPSNPSTVPVPAAANPTATAADVFKSLGSISDHLPTVTPAIPSPAYRSGVPPQALTPPIPSSPPLDVLTSATNFSDAPLTVESLDSLFGDLPMADSTAIADSVQTLWPLEPPAESPEKKKDTETRLHQRGAASPPGKHTKPERFKSPWYLGLDVGTVDLSAVLFNRETGQLYPIYWLQQVAEPLSPQSTTVPLGSRDPLFRLPIAAYLNQEQLMDGHIPQAPVAVGVAAFNLPCVANADYPQIGPTSGVAPITRDAHGLLLRHLKPQLKLGIPHYSPQTMTWEPELQWSERHTVPLGWCQHTLQTLLSTLCPTLERAGQAQPNPLGLACAAVGLESNEFQTAMATLHGVAIGHPAQWPEAYLFNLREAILAVGLVEQADRIHAVADGVAIVLSGLEGNHHISNWRPQTPWRGGTVVLDIGASCTEMAVVNLPNNNRDLHAEDFYCQTLPYAGEFIDQDIIGQLLCPAATRQPLPLQQRDHGIMVPPATTGWNWEAIAPQLANQTWESLGLEQLTLPTPGRLDPEARRRLRRHLETTILGQAMMEVATHLKQVLHEQSQFTLRLAGQQWIVKRQDLELKVLLPFIQYLNRQMNQMLSRTQLSAVTINQVVCTGGIASLPVIVRWLRQKLPNATIIQDTYPSDRPAICSRVAYGLATLPLYSQVLDLQRHQYSDYFLFKELLRVCSDRSEVVAQATLMQRLESRGINTQACQARLLALFNGAIPLGLIPTQPDEELVSPRCRQNATYQALLAKPLFIPQPGQSYRIEADQVQLMRRYLDLLLTNTRQTLDEPLTFTLPLLPVG